MEKITKNKYVRRAKISEHKFRKMVKCFAADMSATQIAEAIEVNRNTVNRYLNEIRARMVEFCEQYAPFQQEFNEEQELLNLCSEDEIIESTPITTTLKEKISTSLGILKRRGKVYVEMLATTAANKLQQLRSDKSAISEDLTIHAIDVKEQYGLIAVGYDNNQSFADKPSYVDDLDRFWLFARERTSKFQGLAKHKFYYHLKECEFRFNFRNDNLYSVILQLISAKPIS